MSDWARLKNTKEYAEAKKEIEGMIRKATRPMATTISELTAEVDRLHSELEDVKARLPKA